MTPEAKWCRRSLQARKWRLEVVTDRAGAPMRAVLMRRSERGLPFFIFTAKHIRGKSKRRTCALVLSAMALLVLSTACNGKEKSNEIPSPNRSAEKFSLSVTLNKSIYSLGEPITVAITSLVFDEGNASIIYERNPNPLYDYEITLVDQQEQSIPFTKLGERLQLTRPSHVEWMLAQDTPWHDSFRLDDLFDLSESGMYTLALRQKVWTSLTSSRELTTDSITFTRLPGK